MKLQQMISQVKFGTCFHTLDTYGEFEKYQILFHMSFHFCHTIKTRLQQF